MMKSINVEFGDHYRNHQPRVVWIPKKQHPIRDRNFLVSVFFYSEIDFLFTVVEGGRLCGGCAKTIELPGGRPCDACH